MSIYYLTAYSKKGEHLLNETLEASSDSEAKSAAVQRLEEESLSDMPSRLVRSEAGLVHFHP
ncbi:YhzD family protein [Alkalicoccus chagannorensis]